MADQCRFIASFEKTPASQHYIFSHSTKWTLTTHRKPKAHYRTQVQLLQKMLTILQMHWTDSQFFLQTYKYHTASISTLSQDKQNVLCVYVTKQAHLGPALQFQRPLWQKWWEVWLRWGSSARRLPVSHSGSSQRWSTLGRHDHTWEHSVSVGCFRAAWEIPPELVHSPVLLVLIKSQVSKAGVWRWWMVNRTHNPRPTKGQKSSSQNCKLIYKKKMNLPQTKNQSVSLSLILFSIRFEFWPQRKKKAKQSHSVASSPV